MRGKSDSPFSSAGGATPWLRGWLGDIGGTHLGYQPRWRDERCPASSESAGCGASSREKQAVSFFSVFAETFAVIAGTTMMALS